MQNPPAEEEQEETLTLLALPVEMLDTIAAFLDTPSYAALRWTCRALHSCLDSPRLGTSSRERIAHLLHMERWPVYANLWACSNCVRLRPPRKFTLGMIQHKRAKGAVAARTRLCGDCGVERGVYDKGRLFRFAGSAAAEDGGGVGQGRNWGIVCKRCGQLKLVERDSTAALRRKCTECMDYRPPGSIWQRDVRVSTGVAPVTSDERRHVFDESRAMKD